MESLQSKGSIPPIASISSIFSTSPRDTPMQTPAPLLPSFSLAGRRALVTGASRGIGAAIARALAAAGADVAVHCVSNRAAAEAVAESIRALGRRAVIVVGDLAAADAPQSILRQTMDALGRLDILVANASVQFPENWQAVSREHFDTQVATNFRATFELIQRAAPPMLDRRWGRILTVGSVQECRPHPDMVVYAATKSAQTSMVRNFAKQFAPFGVTVNNLAPGVIDTDRNRLRLADPVYGAKVLAAIPANRYGATDDCAGAALLLCSDAGSYITGQNLYVDGGMGL
jgi:NAD(P)-dependent dehydrogenase (short-subunit alcohol dehydrogenase family)